jgi:hypothetical protein
VILCGGSRNTGKHNTTKGRHYVTQFDNRRNTNVMIMSNPPRFDLATISCVNGEVKVFNKKLQRISRRIKKVTNQEIIIFYGCKTQ